MTPLILAALAVLGYLYMAGKLPGPAVWSWVAGIAGAVLTLSLARNGQLLGAAFTASSTMAWLGWRQRAAVPKVRVDEAEARDILGVGPTATHDEVRAAHRRLIQQVHPDKGGSAELARRVNAARDRLLKR